ncbi:MAG TPA: hypothetical protein VF453_08190 [Burkholderiaceae bacterium]
MVNAGRRQLQLAALAFAAAAAGGCAAPGSAPVQHSTYTETISSVLVSEDNAHIAAIGASHHYIFDAPPLLVRALHSPAHGSLQATFSTFHVARDGKVTGEYELALPAGAPADVQKAAADIGLQHEPDGRWDVHGMLSGQRYTGWTYKLGREQDRLNQPYTIEFTTDFTAADRAVDKAATPIRTAADGVQLIYYAPLAPVILPIIFLSKARDH